MFHSGRLVIDIGYTSNDDDDDDQVGHRPSKVGGFFSSDKYHSTRGFRIKTFIMEFIAPGRRFPFLRQSALTNNRDTQCRPSKRYGNMYTDKIVLKLLRREKKRKKKYGLVSSRFIRASSF